MTIIAANICNGAWDLEIIIGTMYVAACISLYTMVNVQFVIAYTVPKLHESKYEHPRNN